MLNYHYFLQVSSAYLLFHFAHLGMVWIQPIAPFSHHRHVKFDYYIHDGSSSPNSETLGEIITPIYMHLLSALKQKGLHYQIPHRKPKSLCLNMAIIWSSNIHSEILNMTMVQVGNEGCYFHKRQFSRETNFLLCAVAVHHSNQGTRWWQIGKINIIRRVCCQIYKTLI